MLRLFAKTAGRRPVSKVQGLVAASGSTTSQLAVGAHDDTRRRLSTTEDEARRLSGTTCANFAVTTGTEQMSNSWGWSNGYPKSPNQAKCYAGYTSPMGVANFAKQYRKVTCNPTVATADKCCHMLRPWGMPRHKLCHTCSEV